MLTRHLSFILLLIGSMSCLEAMSSDQISYYSNRNERKNLNEKKNILLQKIVALTNQLEEIKKEIEAIPTLQAILTYDQQEKNAAQQQEKDVEKQYTVIQNKLTIVTDILSQEASEKSENIKLCDVCHGFIDIISFDSCSHKIHTACISRLKAIDTFSLDDNNDQDEQESYRCPQCPGSTFTQKKQKRSAKQSTEQTKKKAKKSSIPASAMIISLDDKDNASEITLAPTNISSTPPTSSTTTTTTTSTSTTANSSSRSNSNNRAYSSSLSLDYAVNYIGSYDTNLSETPKAQIECRKDASGNFDIQLNLIRNGWPIARAKLYPGHSELNAECLLVIPNKTIIPLSSPPNTQSELISYLPNRFLARESFLVYLNRGPLSPTLSEFDKKIEEAILLNYHTTNVIYINDLLTVRGSHMPL